MRSPKDRRPQCKDSWGPPRQFPHCGCVCDRTAPDGPPACSSRLPARRSAQSRKPVRCAETTPSANRTIPAHDSRPPKSRAPASARLRPAGTRSIPEYSRPVYLMTERRDLNQHCPSEQCKAGRESRETGLPANVDASRSTLLKSYTSTRGDWLNSECVNIFDGENYRLTLKQGDKLDRVVLRTIRTRAVPLHKASRSQISSSRWNTLHLRNTRIARTIFRNSSLSSIRRKRD